MLRSTTLPLTYPPSATGLILPTHDAQYWARVAAGMDFSSENRMDVDRYNHILWTGLMGSNPYPEEPTGNDLRRNRQKLLARYYKKHAAEKHALSSASPPL